MPANPQPATSIENIHKFHVFYNALTLQHLWSEHFFELADNGLLGCSQVVGVNSRKGVPFRGDSCATSGPDWPGENAEVGG